MAYTAGGYDPGTFYGSTVAFTTAPTLIVQAISVKWSGVSRKEVDTTHLLSTGGYMTSMPGDIIDTGTLDMVVKFNANLDYTALFLSGRCDTLTITFPKRQQTSCPHVALGADLPTTAAKVVMSTVLLSYEVQTENDKVMTLALKMKVTGAPTFTAAS